MSQLNLTDRIRPGWAPNQLRPGERCRLVLHPTQHISVLGLLDDVLSWRGPTNGGPWTAARCSRPCSLVENNTSLPKDHVSNSFHLGEF
jgi:hypothetical protein